MTSCFPGGVCSCMCHMPGMGIHVKHIVPCCDQPPADPPAWHDGIDWTGELQVAPREGETLEDVIEHNRKVAERNRRGHRL